MTALTPRDALEVVRRRACVTGDDFLSEVREALSVLTNLVDRAGELVAYISQTALDALNKCRNDDHNGIVDIWMRPNDTLKATIPLYTTPGASHER